VSQWFVANTKPNQETLALEHLRRQGFSAWLPRYRKTRRHARRFDTIQAPLFPGYLFVELDPVSRPWRSVNGTFGVRHLICRDGAPAPLPADFVRDLRAQADDGGLITQALPALAKGMVARVVAGPFVGCIGTLIELDGRERVKVLLGILGGIVASVPASAVAPAG
jgi:transcriptional antiterminator RfaH